MIYIVEDDASIRELEQYALQSNGYEVQGFESRIRFLLKFMNSLKRIKIRKMDNNMVRRTSSNNELPRQI